MAHRKAITRSTCPYPPAPDTILRQKKLRNIYFYLVQIIGHNSRIRDPDVARYHNT